MERTAEELKALQSLPLHLKIEWAKQKIQDWYDHWNGEVVLSYSGGIDSHVLRDIIDDMGLDVPSVFVDTGLEYPEIRTFVKEQGGAEWVKPEMNFRRVLDKHGYPIISKRQAQYIREARTSKSDVLIKLRLTGIGPDGRRRPASRISRRWQFLVNAPFKISERCCHALKRNPIRDYVKRTGRRFIVGTMASDSEERALQWKKRGCNAFDVKDPQSYPLSVWNKQDVLQYIVDRGLPVCSVYGDIIVDAAGFLRNTGVSRTGCTFCGFGCHIQTRDEGQNKFQQMAETHPALYNYCMEKLNMRQVLEFCKIPYRPRQNKGMGL